MCGADFPIRISALGESGPLGYDDEPVRPPGAIPRLGAAALAGGPVERLAAERRRAGAAIRPAADRRARAPSPAAPAQLGPMQATAAQPGRPMSLYAPGVPDPGEDDAAFEPDAAAALWRNAAGAKPSAGGQLPAAKLPAHRLTRRAHRRRPASRSTCRLAGRATRAVTASVGPVEVKPAATLACPIVSALDQWISDGGAAGGAALVPSAGRRDQTNIRLFMPRHERQSERAHIRARLRQRARHRRVRARRRPQDHRAIRLARLARGAGISARRAARRLPGIHHRAGARRQHLSLQSHSCRSDAPISGRRICQPARDPRRSRRRARAGAYASQHYGDPATTGSIAKRIKRALGYSGEDDDRLPLAVPGED